MGKTYIDTVKYLVYANVDIGGLVEKPDVVGAIFGQTEGLLGDELDLRDLQKNGRIGRIEVDLNGKDGRTIGVIKIPSSLDMVETCIIAAALETVDRVGPCEANISVQKVEDTRNVKRKVLVDRAKGLLKGLLRTEIPESREISDMVRDEVKTAEIGEYGADKLPAGPGIDKVNDVVFVEGRADVINLLKNDITNVVAIQGAKITKTIIQLSKEKEVTVFLDGDRGGDIILNELVQGGAEIDYITRAPDGKEVEELTRKEIIKCIRSKIPFEQGPDRSSGIKGAPKFVTAKKPERREQEDFQPQPRQERRGVDLDFDISIKEPEKTFEKQIQQIRKDEAIAPIVAKLDSNGLLKELEELNNTLRARFYNSKKERVKEIAVRDVIKALEEIKDIEAIVFDGIITQRLVDLASNKGVRLLVGVKVGNVNRTPEGIQIVTKDR
ncbi:MAG: DNA primase DnaG [Candidatus Micrarchaeota archaeon]|nr:DNA primase DnaG [Candidatus Micrarchaeota archaeon]